MSAPVTSTTSSSARERMSGPRSSITAPSMRRSASSTRRGSSVATSAPLRSTGGFYAAAGADITSDRTFTQVGLQLAIVGWERHRLAGGADRGADVLEPAARDHGQRGRAPADDLVLH